MNNRFNNEVLLEIYKSMLLIRRVEEKIIELYPEREMRCPTHLCIGQEAIPAGVIANLSLQDCVFSNHRNHGHYLAKGGNLKAMIAEIYGKVTGCCEGRGGSMHMIDLLVNFIASTPIVGGTIPIAAGSALASKMQRKDNITVVFFGDSAIEGGALHETLNFSELHKLPLLLVCENNLYSTQTHIRDRQPNREITQVVKGHGVEAFKVDGNDPIAIYETTKKAVQHIKSGNGPVFMEFSTYRWREHCGPNEDKDLGYRDEKEILEWMAKDPIKKLREDLLEQELAIEKDLETMDEAIKQNINEAFTFAKESPFPDKDRMYEHLYSE